MATLLSPGSSITVTDESQYLPTGVGTVPLVVLATAENKTNPSGGTATGTTMATAGKLQAFSSQRDLITALGYPKFQTSGGSPIHGDERNEYGLQAVYSALGIGSSAFVIRADIDLAALTATAVRPTGAVADGTVWLDLTNTSFGVYVWNQNTQVYTAVTPRIITSVSQVNNDTLNTPLATIGAIGEYAVVAYNVNNPLFYKNASNTWVPVGTVDWQEAFPTVQSGFATYASAPVADGTTITINGTTVTCTATNGITCTGADVVSSINGAFTSSFGAGVGAALDANGRLVIYATAVSKSNGSTSDGKLLIASGAGATALGFTAGTYYAPLLSFGPYTNVPTYGSGDATPAPSGSIWVKTTSVGSGANWVVNSYSASASKFTKVAAPLYTSKEDALYNLDILNGGQNIKSGSLFIDYSTLTGYPATFKLYQRNGTGQTKVTGSVPASNFTIGNTFTIAVSEPGSDALVAYSFTGNYAINSVTTAGFVSLILSRNIPNLYAQVESNGAISLIHLTGGDIVLKNGTGTPVATAGFSTSTTGIEYEANGTYAGGLRASKWKALGSSYIFSSETPYVAPANGTLWYYGNSVEADVMVCGPNGWAGYNTLANDSRGYNLQNTDLNGPIFSPITPTLQSTGDAVVAGDLWVDTSDLENFPKLSRYTGTVWTLIDNTDRITQNGIVFADARWDASVDTYGHSVGGIIDPVAGSLPAISDMIMSNYIDLDCPDYRLYPRGTLLWNTRRNGMNVKQFVSNKFTPTAYPNALAQGTNHQKGTIPTDTSTWASASGNDTNGTPFSGHMAQRQMVVKALKAAIDTNTDVREDQYKFDLIVCPGYPEVIPNMVNLNVDRAQTAFVIGDTPMDLTPDTVSLTNWSNNEETTGDVYLGVYYPSGLTTDYQGNTIAVPPSHMALRTFIYSDNVSYPWFAPAGTNRGVVTNATQIGYVNYTSGNFVKTGITQSQRDVLYGLNINPISLLPGAGLTIFGNKTRSPRAQATDRVNVSRLVNYIRTVLSGITNQYLFEPNDKSTRDAIKTSIESVFNDLITKRGIYDYAVVCDTSNNTSSRIANNQLWVDIAIEPMKDVEFIYIPIRLENPGTIAGSTSK